MDKELTKKLVAQGKAYVLDLRGGSVPYKEGNAAAVDFYCPQDVVLNMPWVKMGRGHINLHLGIELPKGVGLDIRSRSGFTDKGMEVDVAFIGKNETQVGYMTNVRADIDICLGLVDEDYRNDIGALYRVNSDRYMPTKDSKFKLDSDYEYYVFVVKKGTRVCQGAFRKVENPDCILGELNMENNRGGGYGHGGTK